jgi:hypothetical protein
VKFLSCALILHSGKLAVLKDDEVERLERVSKAACSVYSRQDIMESMYGRVEPKPIGNCKVSIILSLKPNNG